MMRVLGVALIFLAILLWQIGLAVVIMIIADVKWPFGGE